jgi:mRNA interferase RelE/StbE
VKFEHCRGKTNGESSPKLVPRCNPRPPGCVKLSGTENLWRFRMGVYRIIYTIQDDRLLVTVVRVGHRRDVYRDM